MVLARSSVTVMAWPLGDAPIFDQVNKSHCTTHVMQLTRALGVKNG